MRSSKHSAMPLICSLKIKKTFAFFRLVFYKFATTIFMGAANDVRE